MSNFWTRFLEGTSIPLRIACLGFALALCGFVLAFSIDYGPQNRLSYIAFGMGVLGVGTGFLGIALGWLTGLSRLAFRLGSKAPDLQAAATPPVPTPTPGTVLSGPGGEG